MATLELTLIKKGRVLETFSFEDEERVLVGRNEDCDVRVDSPSVSRHHCEFLRDEGFYRLTDLGSSHGTFVNGKRVIEASLNDGDVVTIGEFNLNYKSTLAVATPAGPDPVAHRGGDLTVEIAAEGVSEAGGARATAKTRAHLTIAYEDGRERNLLLQKTTFIIGRVENADLQVSGWRTPRVAAIILRDRFTFRIVDTSPKGKVVRVNGRRVRLAELETGDKIEVVNRRMRFYRGLPQLDENATKKEERWIHRRGN